MPRGKPVVGKTHTQIITARGIEHEVRWTQARSFEFRMTNPPGLMWQQVAVYLEVGQDDQLKYQLQQAKLALEALIASDVTPGMSTKKRAKHRGKWY